MPAGWQGRWLFITEVVVVPLVFGHEPVIHVFAEYLAGIGGFHFECGADGVEAGDAVDFIVFFGGLGNVGEVVVVGWYL